MESQETGLDGQGIVILPISMNRTERVRGMPLRLEAGILDKKKVTFLCLAMAWYLVCDVNTRLAQPALL
jgi:hypothetical protein